MNVYVAEPSRRAELLELLDEVARRAKSREVAPLVYGEPFDGKATLDDHNLYFSHLAVILGVRRIVACGAPRDRVGVPQGSDECAPDSQDSLLQRRLVDHLRARTLASSLSHAPSYPESAMWPADQSVTLLAFRLYDEAQGTHLVDAPLAGFLSTMAKHSDHTTHLYHSAVTPLDYATTPRGCALSWTSLYLAQVAPEAGRAQYSRYREHMSADILGFGGFREWPVNRGQGMDADSGPIIFGVGMAATGFGLGAARLFEDADRYATIRRTALTFGLPSWISSHGYVMAPVLGEAILFHGRTARTWFGERTGVPRDDRMGVPHDDQAEDAPRPPRRSSFSFVSLAFLLGYGALVAAWARRVLRRASR
jgi:hypothetical protein